MQAAVHRCVQKRSAFPILHPGTRRATMISRTGSHRNETLNNPLQSPACKGIPRKRFSWSTGAILQEAWSILAKFPFWQDLPRTELKPALLELSGLTRILGSGDNCSLSPALQRTKSNQEAGAIQTDGIREPYLWCWIQPQSQARKHSSSDIW